MDMEGLTERISNNPVASRRVKYYEDINGEIVAKVCTKCSRTRPQDDFYNKKSGIGNRSSECKQCSSARSRKYRELNSTQLNESKRQYYEQNRDRLSENARKYREENKELLSERDRVRYANNKEKRAESMKKWYESNKHRMAEYSKKYYEINKDNDHFIQMRQQYRDSNKERRAESDRHYRINNLEKIRENQRKWTVNNREKVAVSQQRRRARKAGLPNTLTVEEYGITLEYFGGACAITGQTAGVEKEHAIPLSVGHGGTTFENCYPMANGLNQSKGNRNIFEWFEANRQRFDLSQERFDKLIAYLASANAMTVEEYRAHVDWCHANPRSIDEIKEAN